jgi:hypothetical protein
MMTGRPTPAAIFRTHAQHGRDNHMGAAAVPAANGTYELRICSPSMAATAGAFLDRGARPANWQGNRHVITDALYLVVRVPAMNRPTCVPPSH